MTKLVENETDLLAHYRGNLTQLPDFTYRQHSVEAQVWSSFPDGYGYKIVFDDKTNPPLYGSMASYGEVKEFVKGLAAGEM